MVTFKVDDKKIKAGEVRVEVELLEGFSLIVVLTQEGIITDCYSGEKNVGTSSITYLERFEAILGNMGD